MYLLDGKKLRQGRPFTHNDIQYPSNWLNLTSESEKTAIGITWQDDPAPFDSRFYISSGVPKQLEDIGPDPNTGITTTGLKTKFKEDQDNTSHSLLSPTDWYVVRKSENDTAIPVGVTSFRTAVRTICESRKVAIAGAADVPALVGVCTFHGLNWPSLQDYV